MRARRAHGISINHGPFECGETAAVPQRDATVTKQLLSTRPSRRTGPPRLAGARLAAAAPTPQRNSGEISSPDARAWLGRVGGAASAPLHAPNIFAAWLARVKCLTRAGHSGSAAPPRRARAEHHHGGDAAARQPCRPCGGATTSPRGTQGAHGGGRATIARRPRSRGVAPVCRRASSRSALTDAEKQTLELVMRMYMEERLGRQGAGAEHRGRRRAKTSRHRPAAGDGCDYNTPSHSSRTYRCTCHLSCGERLRPRRGARRGAGQGGIKFQRCKLTLIRSCNELLRRLKSKNTISAGACSCSWRTHSRWRALGREPQGRFCAVDGGCRGGRRRGADAGRGGRWCVRQRGPRQRAAGTDQEAKVDFGFYATFWGLQAFADPASSVGKELADARRAPPDGLAGLRLLLGRCRRARAAPMRQRPVMRRATRRATQVPTATGRWRRCTSPSSSRRRN